MASSTQFWNMARIAPEAQASVRARTLPCLLCLLALLAQPLPGQAQPVQADNLQLQKTEEGLLLNTSLRFDLPVAVEDALLKGVPVVFSTQADVVKERWYWYNKVQTSVQRNMRLSYQPLTRRWRLQTYGSAGHADAALTQTHETLSSAMAAVRSVQRWKIADWSELESDTRYTLEFRFRLDTHQLPRLFQIGASNAGDWNLSFSRSLRWIHDGRLDGPK